MHDVEVLVDVRSSPYAKYSTHFNQSSLSATIKLAGLKYLFMGAEIGGMPKNPEFYDDEGYVLYWKIAESPEFKESITRILNGIRLYKVTLMCGEENPAGCHRRLLISRVLKSHGLTVNHIRGDGHLESEDEMLASEKEQHVQLTLFNQQADEEEEWKSKQIVRTL